MSRKFTLWLDSGANIHSTFKTTVTLDELGIESDEWDAMSESEKDEAMRETAFAQSDWGYAEIESDKDEQGEET
jgi:hypothetical protein